jgi:methanogenic corrinoid protein MtbC1
MPFIYKDADIRDRRVKLFIDNLHQAFTRLMLIDKEAADLIDAEQEKAEIALLSAVDGETFPVLPFGDELVFQFNSIGLDFDSESKFIFEEHEGQDMLYSKTSKSMTTTTRVMKFSTKSTVQ